MSDKGLSQRNSVRAYVFRFALEPGHCSMQSACRKRARSEKSYFRVFTQPGSLTDLRPCPRRARSVLETGRLRVCPGCQLRANSRYQSITSSARPSSAAGSGSPREFAVFALIIRSIFVTWRTGKSSGLSPFSTRPIISTTCRKASS